MISSRFFSFFSSMSIDGTFFFSFFIFCFFSSLLARLFVWCRTVLWLCVIQLSLDNFRSYEYQSVNDEYRSHHVLFMSVFGCVCVCEDFEPFRQISFERKNCISCLLSISILHSSISRFLSCFFLFAFENCHATIKSCVTHNTTIAGSFFFFFFSLHCAQTHASECE